MPGCWRMPQARLMHSRHGDRLKTQMVNAYYAQGIIDVLEKNSNTPLNKERANEIFGFAADAA